MLHFYWRIINSSVSGRFVLIAVLCNEDLKKISKLILIRLVRSDATKMNYIPLLVIDDDDDDNDNVGVDDDIFFLECLSSLSLLQYQ